MILSLNKLLNAKSAYSTVKKSEKCINKEKINKIKPTAFSKLHKKR